MTTFKQISLLAFRVIGLVAVVIALLIAALWARDAWKDRKHVVMVESETPIFAGGGNESCGGTQLTIVQAGAALPVQRIRYWKECATANIVLPDGREGYIVLGKGAVVIRPPLTHLINVRDLSKARFHKSVKSGEVLCARSIEPFEGGRWRLRRMRASDCTDLTAVGIESFFVCSLLILLGLRKSEETKNRSQKLYLAA